MLPFDNKTLHNRVAEQKIYDMLLPEMQNTKTKLRGSSFGWLIVFGIDGTLRMLNPFTKKHIDLPPLSTLPCVIGYNPNQRKEEYSIIDYPDDDDKPYNVSSKYAQRALVQKVILSCPPDDVNQDFMAIVIYGASCTRLAFYRRRGGGGGDSGVNNNSKWIDLPKPGRVSETLAQSDYGYEDAIFHAGKIYLIDKKYQIFGFDLPDTQQLSSNIIEVPAPHDFPSLFSRDFKYLIGCPDGGILIVVRGLNFYENPNQKPGDPDLHAYNSSKFEIFKLEKGSKQWSRVFDLKKKNCMLFIGFNSSIWITTDTTIPNGRQGNQLHFSDNFCELQHNRVRGGNDIGVLNLDDGNITQLFPTLTLISSPPLWLV